MFISFEGTEGVGKSTLIAGLQQRLTDTDRPIIVTREPGGTPLAEKIRELLLTPNTEMIASHTELLLLYAARAQHLATVIEPALTDGALVLCDRFIDATMAYQCGGRGLSADLINSLNRQFVSQIPHLTFWLDAPVAVGMQRAQKRGALDRFEQERLDFFERVRAVYRQLHQQQPQRIIRLDATQDAATLQQQAYDFIIQYDMKR